MAYWIWSIRPEHYSAFVRTGTFAVRRQGRPALARVRPGDRIFAYLPKSRVLAGLFEATSGAFEDATALVAGGHYPHRVRVRPLVALFPDAWVPYDAFATQLAVLNDYADRPTPELRFRAVVQQVVHPLPNLDGKVLEFLVRAREGADQEAIMAAYERLKQAREAPEEEEALPAVREAAPRYVPDRPFERANSLERLIEGLAARGFVYAPWQVASFVTALRTKPFVILAGVTGVGKSRLPLLVAEATGGFASLIPVRPDWTDPAETLGYTDLQGTFRPGAVLRAAREATDDPARYHFAVLDEMNLARPEHYLAEVLSRIEDRRPVAGGFASASLLTERLAAPDAAWQAVGLPSNLGLVGTVNVDESGHPFSKKVLDRAFTLELDATDLAQWAEAGGEGASVEPWPSSAWAPRAVRLGGLGKLSKAERGVVQATVDAVAEAHALLAPAGLGVGYRARDEAALFVLHASETPDTFRTAMGEPVDPLDLALFTKLLPRFEGGRAPVREAVLALLGWAVDGTPRRDESAAAALLDGWESTGRTDDFPGARFPRTAARLARMADALLSEGFASFWS